MTDTYNDEVIQALSRAIARGEAGLADIPGLIKLIIENRLWQRRRVVMSNELIEFRTFREFAEARLPQGLGTDIWTLEKLCRDDKPALDALDKVLHRSRGGDRRSDDFKAVKNIFENTRFSNPTRLGLRRLAAERPDLHAKVLESRLSVNAALVQAGFRQRALTIFPDDVDRTVRTLRRQLSPVQLRELAARLAECNRSEDEVP